MDIITWLVVGLVAGVLASAVMGGTGYGILGDIVLGIIGAFVGGWTFRELRIHSPWGGIAGVILVAFIGSVIVLALVRVARSISARRTNP